MTQLERRDTQGETITTSLQIPRRPLYYIDAPLDPISSRPAFPQIPGRDKADERLIRVLDPSSKAQRERYDGDPDENRLRLASSVERGSILELGNRVVNGTRFAMAEKTRFGLGLSEIRNDVRFADHGHEHERRVMKWIADILVNGHELHLQDPGLIFALAQFNDHDNDQLITQARNSARKKEGLPALDSKRGHGPAEVLRQYATVQFLADEAGISLDAAKELRYLSGALILLHDEPEKLDRCLAQTEIVNGRKAYNDLGNGQHELLHGEELMQALNEGVDLLTLRPSQIAEITVIMKRQKNGVDTGFVTDKTPHGLDEPFELIFADQLNTITQGDYFRMGDASKGEVGQEPLPLSFQDLNSDDFREQFTIAMRIAEFADLMDKVIPTEEAALRKLTVEKSTRIPFYRPQFMESVLTKDGIVDDAEDSDVRRTDWELRHVGERLQRQPGQKSQPLSDSLYIRRLAESIGISGLMAQKRIGEIIMRGNEEEIEQFITDVYDRQLSLLAQKYLKRANLELPHNGESLSERIEQVIGALRGNNKVDYAERLAYLEGKNRLLVEHTMNCLRSKPDHRIDNEGKPHVRQYSSEEIEAFKAEQDKLLQHEYTQEQIEAYLNGQEKKTLYPFETVLSSGSPWDARTYRRHPHHMSRTEASPVYDLVA